MAADNSTKAMGSIPLHPNMRRSGTWTRSSTNSQKKIGMVAKDGKLAVEVETFESGWQHAGQTAARLEVRPEITAFMQVLWIEIIRYAYEYHIDDFQGSEVGEMNKGASKM
jgi:hypothetical protein